MPSVSRTVLLAGLPPEPVLAPRRAAAKLVVLDDDPTGTQTVHGVPVLTAWDVPALAAELQDPSPCFYLLTNTRAFPPERACAINREIGAGLAEAGRRTGRAFTVISRGDSTLRGHYPAETDALMAALGGGFDGTILVPAFFDGGRCTVGDVHYVADGDTLTPAGETEFARDASFGYRSSNLRDWVAEKTAGRVPAAEVVGVPLDELRRGGADPVAARLAALPRGGVAFVNAAGRGDLAVLTHALAAPALAGRRYLFRTAADFVAAYAGLARRPLLGGGDLAGPDAAVGGLLVAGSYVGRTSAQLEALFAARPGFARVEVSVNRLLAASSRAAELARCVAAVEEHLRARTDVALFTSRRLVTGADAADSLAIGKAVSSGLVEIVRALAVRPRWLVAKGGITSSDVATASLGVRRALVLGQALPGVPVWRTGPESKWPGLAYVVFPGNVGSPYALADLVGKLPGAS
ncbi:MAG: hypothetical protein JNG83_15140 [Opitutaceae bacterium]|nr:hypothetical protein [Opitutaceae bacterium]